MRSHFPATLVCLAFGIFPGVLPAQLSTVPPLRALPEESRWQSPMPGGFPFALITGAPNQQGTYVVRAKFNPGFRVEPHSHPDTRIVMVVSGAVLVGYGDRFEEGAMKQMTAGSVWTEPANQSHFAWAKDGEVELLVVGFGPSGTTPVRSR